VPYCNTTAMGKNPLAVQLNNNNNNNNNLTFFLVKHSASMILH
jgi:hypothetical protein